MWLTIITCCGCNEVKTLDMRTVADIYYTHKKICEKYIIRFTVITKRDDGKTWFSFPDLRPYSEN